MSDTSSDPRSWAPEGSQEVADYEWFRSRFGRDEITVVSWPGCTLQDPRAERLATALLERRDDRPAFFQRAVTGGRVFRQLTSPPVDLPPHVARERLRGVLLGPDERTTCLVLTVSAAGAADRPAAIEQIYRTAERECGLSRDEIRLGGPTVDGAAIAAESRRTLYRLAVLSAIVVFAAVWWQMGSLVTAILIEAAAFYATAGTVAFLHFSGGTMTLLMTNIVPLVFVLNVSGAVHLVNYFRAALAEPGYRHPAEEAVARGWLPCALAAGTTAAGFLSLTTSSIGPIRLFGLYAAFGMGVNLAALLLFVPAGLELIYSRAMPADPDGSPGFSSLAGRICRRHLSVSVAGCLLVAAAGVGLLRIESSVKLQDRFPTESRILRDYRWLERHVAPLVPLETVVRFEDATGLSFAGRIAVVAAIQRELERVPGVEATLSAAELLPDLPPPDSLGRAIRRRISLEKLRRRRESLAEAGYFADTGAAELWRITARVNALNEIDYGHFVETVRGQTDAALESKPRGLRITYTGAIPLVYKVQRQLLYDLAKSFLLAFGVISVVMVLVFRDVRSGLVAMLPNLFPPAVVFGAMGWAGMHLDIGSVMTASIGLGIAVDDTFHFLTWFRRGLEQGKSRQNAVVFAYQRCARAMIQTTVICSLGILVFVSSSYLPTVRFACLLAALLGMALVGDLIVLPALLAGPIGRLFERRGLRREVEQPTPIPRG